MNELSVRPTDKDLENLVLAYSNMLFKLCFTMLCNNADAEDAVSEVVVRYIIRAPQFNDEEHKKAWLLRTAANLCKDMLRQRKRRSHVNLDDVQDYCTSEESTSLINEILSLPQKYKTVIHLHYIEGYKTGEIAEILSITPQAVRKRLQYGRNMLRIEYERTD